MTPLNICILLACLFINFLGNAQLTANGYTNYNVSGFNVLVEDAAFNANAELTNDAIDLLETKLVEISQLEIAPFIQDSLRAVSIFMDWNTTAGAAVFHPSQEWLVENGYIPEKASCIEISNISNFIDWTNTNQPYMVLHELAHAYHWRAFNFNLPIITDAFNNAVSNNLYTNVSYHAGNGNYINLATAYALENEFEYFAEITEAFFGLNDYFPFDSNDLFDYDLIGYNMALDVWSGNILSVDSPEINALDSIYFPNPTNGLISFNVSDSNMSQIKFDITNVHGKCILSAVSNNESGSIKIDMTNAAAGLYFLKVVQNNFSKTFKVIKE